MNVGQNEPIFISRTLAELCDLEQSQVCDKPTAYIRLVDDRSFRAQEHKPIENLRIQIRPTHRAPHAVYFAAAAFV